MDLVPCGVCRRHVDSRASSCPFCATPITRSVKRLIDAGGRLSRAAVFAGAAACYTNPAPAQHITTPPPPPPADAAVVEQQQQQQFAQPPDDANTATATANGAIEGTLYDGNHQPASGTLVCRGQYGGELRVQTDANGHYRFADLPPGNYEIETPWNGRPMAKPPGRPVQVTAGQTAHADLTLYTPPVDRGPCCKPYGAPPARRRIV
jgi:hypothetical protein